MSQSDELLNQLSESTMVHEHPVSDVDKYFIIDPDTRLISNVSGTINYLMQKDHKSERYTFELPRTVEGHDMALCNRVYVHFINVDSETQEECYNFAEITDLEVNPEDPSTVICTWLIERHATQLIGGLSFLVQYACVTDDGNMDYEFHTDWYTNVVVKKGRRDPDPIILEYTNVLEQWYQKIFGTGDGLLDGIEAARLAAIENVNSTAADRKTELNAESQIQQAAIEAKGQATLATIPPDYTALYDMAEQALRTKADAIALEAEGNPIVINDASDGHLLGVKIFGKTEQVTTTGKNLLNNTLTTRTTYGVSATTNPDGSIRVHGVATGNAFFEIGSVELEAGTYILNGCPANGAVATYSMYTLIDGQYIWNVGTDKAFTLTETKTITVNIRVMGGAAANNLTFYPMISISGGTYEPYTGGMPSPNPTYPQDIVSVENPKVVVFGKNFIDITSATTANAALTLSDNAVTVTADTNVTGPARGVIRLDYPLNTPLTLSFDMTIHELAPDQDVIIYFRKGSKYFGQLKSRAIGVKTSHSVTIDGLPESGYDLWLYIRTLSSNDAVSATFENIQVEIGSEATDYEPCEPIQILTTQRTLDAIGDLKDELVYDYKIDTWQLIQNCLRMTFTDFSYAKTTAPSNGFTEGYLTCGVRTKAKAPGLCDKFRYIVSGDMVRFATAAATVYFTLEGELTQDEWVAKMTELKPTIVVPRETPLITELTTEEVLAFKALHTNKTNTVIQNGVGAHMEVTYAADTKTFIANTLRSVVKELLAEQ